MAGAVRLAEELPLWCCVLVHAATPLAVVASENGITLSVAGNAVATAGVAGTAVIITALTAAVTRLKLKTSTRASKTLRIFLFIIFYILQYFYG
ncbi:MAG: hypothetical protein ABR886_00010 [Dehalococcoidales bacterium]